MQSFRIVIIASVAVLGAVLPTAVAAQTLQLLHEFVEPGSHPTVAFEDVDGSLYGWFVDGGPKQGGGIFRLAPDGAYALLYAFDERNFERIGYRPNGLVKGPDGALYGTTWEGYPTSAGTLFRLEGATLTVLHTFTGRRAIGALSFGGDGLLYGTTFGGCGELFQFDPASGTMATIHSFSCTAPSGRNPVGGIAVEGDGTIVGLTQSGGSFGYGTIYKWNGSGLTTLHHFTGIQGSSPMSLIKGIDGAFYGTTWAGSASGTLFRFVPGAGGTPASFSTIHTFEHHSYSRGIVQDADGALYGVELPPVLQPGRVFKWHNGVLSVLHTFNGSDGKSPTGALIINSQGRLVGSTESGGSSPYEGTVFSLATNGTSFSAFSFGNGDPLHPLGPMVRMADGTVYGTTAHGGSAGGGTLYRRAPNGNVEILHHFFGTDGAFPTGLVRGTDGFFYGTTQAGGGTGRSGTLFKWDGETLHALHAFQPNVEGRFPSALVQASDGSFYATLEEAGTSRFGSLVRWDGSTLSVVHQFTSATGFYPRASLINGRDGALYGVTSAGGPAGGGVVFKWDGNGYTVVHAFASSSDEGFSPEGALLWTADGSLFGSTLLGGSHNGGVLFRLNNAGYTVLHHFSPAAGGHPRMPLLSLPDGSIVGATNAGVESNAYTNFGTIFRWNGASLSTVHTFDLTYRTGMSVLGLMVGSDGALYGSTYHGGTGGGGTLFKISFNQAPVITTVAGPSTPAAVNTPVSLTLSYTDGESTGHTCTFVWDDGTPSTTVPGSAGACSATHAYAEAGVYTAAVTVTDSGALSSSASSPYIVVYDPTAGFVTGNGSIHSAAGAYAADASLEGRAQFAFVSRYKKGVSVPTGHTEFHFHVASFKFTSATFEWLVVSGARAQFKGYGTVNGTGDYGFLLTATDGQVNGGGGEDRFRIKIWDRASGVIVYDNVAGASDAFSSANPQAISAGSIIIHAQ